MSGRGVKLILPAGDYSKLQTPGTARIKVYGNVPWYPYAIREPAKPGGAESEVHPLATNLSLEWPGFGVIREVAIAGGTLHLPDWQPGCTVAGKVLLPDGAPYAGKPLCIRFGRYQEDDDHGTVTTGGDGAFTITGLLPGPHFIFLPGGRPEEANGWVVDVPETGPAKLALQMTSTPVRIPGSEQFTGYPRRGQECWWLPDDGKPVRIYGEYGDPGRYDLQPGEGWMWCYGFGDGDARYYRLTLAPGLVKTPKEPPIGPTLGIILPFTGTDLPTGIITLTGKEQRAGLQAQFPSLLWQYSAVLGVAMAQIDAVPPGTYTVAYRGNLGSHEKTVTITALGGWAAF